MGGIGGTSKGTVSGSSRDFDDDEKGRKNKQSFLTTLSHLESQRVDPFNFPHSASGGVDGSNINGVERTAIITMTNSNHHNDSDITMNIQIQSTTNRGSGGG